VALSGNRRQREFANDERARSTDEVCAAVREAKPLKGGTLDVAVG
jgi:hypothetical protein